MYRVHCLIGCCFLTTALANLSLDQAGAIWQYTTSSLAGTTSAKCKGAYAEEVTCSRQLLQLTGRPSPENRPSAEDLSAICTSECEESLEDYISAVEQQCKLPGDAAEETTDAPSGQSPADHVWIAGNMLKYTWTQACAKDSNGEYCYLTKGYSNITNPDPDVDCTDSCTLQYYKHRHEFGPASTHYFARSELLKQPRQVLDSWHDTYRRMTECQGWQDAIQGVSQAAVPTPVTGLLSTTAAADLGVATIVLSSTVSGAWSTAKPTSTSTTSTNGTSHRPCDSISWLGLLVFWWMRTMGAKYVETGF